MHKRLGMRSLVLALGLLFVASLAHAQGLKLHTADADPPQMPNTRVRVGVEFLGGLAGSAAAAGIAFSLSQGADGDWITPLSSGVFVYGLISPLLVAGGVSLAGAGVHRDGRFDVALGGASVGLAASIAATAVASELSSGWDTGVPMGVLVGSGVLLPILGAILFYEAFSSMPAAREVAGLRPSLAIAPDGRGAFLGASGQF